MHLSNVLVGFERLNLHRNLFSLKYNCPQILSNTYGLAFFDLYFYLYEKIVAMKYNFGIFLKSIMPLEEFLKFYHAAEYTEIFIIYLKPSIFYLDRGE